MSLLHRLVMSTACTRTHHKVALTALWQLRCVEADDWRRLFWNYYEPYLKGSQAPDDEFRDYKNHVLHVRESCWGGAIAAAQLWYDRLVLALRKQYWADAVYSAGVLSHYLTDPLMPLNTGQTEEASQVRQAVDWSVNHAFDDLLGVLEQSLGGYPSLSLPPGPGWLSTLLKQEATTAHEHFFVVLEHFHLGKCIDAPAQGLDEELKRRLAGQLGRMIVTTARVIDRAIADAHVRPPLVELIVETLMATAKTPYRRVRRFLETADERDLLIEIRDEVRRTGKALTSLPDEELEVRKLHCQQVLRMPLEQLNAAPARPTGLRHGHTVGRLEVLGGSGRANQRVGSEAAQRVVFPSRAGSLPPSRPARHSRQQLAVYQAPSAGRVDDADPDTTSQRPPPRRQVAATEVPVAESLAAADSQLSEASVESRELANRVARPSRLRRQLQVGTARAARAIKRSVARPAAAVGQAFRNVATKFSFRRAAPLDGAERPESAPSEPPEGAGEELVEYRAASDEATSTVDPVSLRESSPIDQAPSIPAKTARRLAALGVRTVADLLAADPADLAAQLDQSWIDPDRIRQWQCQSELCCRIPGLEETHSQILAAAGVTSADELASMDDTSLWELVEPFLATREADQILRGSRRPDHDDVREWISHAHSGSRRRAA